jgi:hypothetical protein
MSVFTITISDQTFDKKSAEVAYIAKCLELAAAEVQRGQGATTSGSIVHQAPNGNGHSSLGTWSYSPSASKP